MQFEGDSRFARRIREIYETVGEPFCSQALPHDFSGVCTI